MVHKLIQSNRTDNCIYLVHEKVVTEMCWAPYYIMNYNKRKGRQFFVRDKIYHNLWQKIALFTQGLKNTVIALNIISIFLSNVKNIGWQDCTKLVTWNVLFSKWDRVRYVYIEKCDKLKEAYNLQIKFHEE